ncbi:MAG TPA: LytTR family DNA-binding domain-containing protein [Gemmatimonadaceae bacterium]|nr:LytTR family DNA-binding domain-containing protein [Gemmatimonadaceae bacterium]
MKIRTLIVDDEPLARERLRLLLSAEPDIELVGECEHGTEAVEAILGGSDDEDEDAAGGGAPAPDLVFLDVQMPELDGFGVVEAVGAERMPTVIFVTAYDEFALRAFDAHALDYLLKPFDDDRFHRALDRARRAVVGRRGALAGAGAGGGAAAGGGGGAGEGGGIAVAAPELVTLLRELRHGSPYLDRLVIKSVGRINFVRAEEIDWISADGNYARLHVGDRSHLLRETMNALAAKLDPKRFVRIHRSTIVNLDRIVELRPGAQGEYTVVLRDNTRLTSSKGYRDVLHERLRLDD